MAHSLRLAALLGLGPVRVATQQVVRAALVRIMLVPVLMSAACAPSVPDDPVLAAGQVVYRTCSSCHGVAGQGGAGPPLVDGAVLITFPTCGEHVKWIMVGSEAWKAEVGDTYGATGKTVRGGMPAFGPVLTEEQIRQVAAYERAQFGGADPVEARADCEI